MLVALIPCRSGSKRIPGKNTKLLGGKPLICWTIEAAQRSGVFDRIAVCADGPLPSILDRYYGLDFIDRPPSRDDERDITWVTRAASDPVLSSADAFAILRPTSPFRTAATIQRAWTRFTLLHERFDSMRAVERVTQHPGKMWVVRHGGLAPICPWVLDEAPWHSTPTQALPAVYIQNSSLEILKTDVIARTTSISGYAVAPFFTQGWEGFSIDYPEDWERAERHVADLQTTAA